LRRRTTRIEDDYEEEQQQEKENDEDKDEDEDEPISDSLITNWDLQNGVADP